MSDMERMCVCCYGYSSRSHWLNSDGLCFFCAPLLEIEEPTDEAHEAMYGFRPH